MTACDAMIWVDKITKRDDYKRQAIAEAKGETK
jgi:hypothetical protein